jgi:acetyl esterase
VIPRTPTVRARRLILRAALALPARVRRRLAPPPAVNDRGVALDADLHLLLHLERLAGPGLLTREPARARRQLRASIAAIEPRPDPAVRTRDLRLADRPARRYGEGAADVLLYLHGGGWVVGDLDTHDAVCRRLHRALGVDVVALDYRLAPEHPFPAGLRDVQAALDALRAQVRGRVLISGDSAGGNFALAAPIANRLAGRALPDGVLAIYPATDLRKNTPSHRLFASGFLLESDTIDHYRAQYGAPWEAPEASILLAPDLSGLPPVVLSTAGFDPLRDEGEAMVEALRRHQVDVVHHDAPTLCHGWVNLDAVVPGADAAFTAMTNLTRHHLLR